MERECVGVVSVYLYVEGKLHERMCESTVCKRKGKVFFLRFNCWMTCLIPQNEA